MTGRSASPLRLGQEHPWLLAGLAILAGLLAFSTLGRRIVDPGQCAPLSAPSSTAPSRDHPFGTDDAGRDLFAVMVRGLPMTAWVGAVAGIVGLSVGVLLGLLGGYVGGRIDACIRAITDTLLTVPSLLVLISVASAIREEVNLTVMALVVASLSWMWPTRTIRSQVLTLRERAFVQMARLNGMGAWEIATRELLPNLLPYLAASFVNAMSSAVLATVYLEALGLGPQNEPTVGMTLYWAMTFNALVRGMWWWWAIPVAFLVLLFLGLFLVSLGLDQWANPRRNRTR